jgi:cation transporter-like permease
MTQIRYIGIQQKPRSFLMQLLGFVVGLVVLGVSLVLGAFVLAALLGFALILAVAVAIRLWRLRRQINADAANDEYIDAEYKVVDSGDRGER